MSAREAADWYARRQRAPLTELEEARFKAWLASDPAGRHEYEQITALWGKLEGVALSPEVMEIRRTIAREAASSAAPPSRISRRTALGLALAAGVAGAAGFLSWQRYAQTDSFATDVGELRTVTLNDGSTVTLDTSSQIRVRFSGRDRRIELLQGQAHFSVAKDASRPFVVSAGGGYVLAIGTVFDVYRRAHDVLVTLIEGRVGVTAADSELIMDAGERVTFGASGREPARSTVDLQRASAWRYRKLDFRDTPLADALSEANRYSRVKIELRAPVLADAKISGVFDAGRNDSLANALRAFYGLSIERVGEDRILLTPEPR